jgi:hypothetical protein
MGMASPEETRSVEAWVKQYPEVATELEAIQSVMQNYAQENAIPPDPSVKEKILTAINTGNNAAPVKEMVTSAAPVRSISPIWRYAAAASIVLLIGSAILNYNYYNKYKDASNDLQTAQTELQKQKDEIAAMHVDMGHMGDMNAKPVGLTAVKQPDDKKARIYWMQDTHEVYIDPSHLSAPPTGMQYQFWAIINGTPVSGGMIDLPDGRVARLQKMKSFDKAEAFAVSLEKAGPEKTAPTEVVVVGKTL